MTQNKPISQSVARVAFVTALLLLIPFTAKFITDEMAWTLSDFIFAGTLIFSTGLTYTLVTKKSKNLIYRGATGLALFSALLLIWLNLAVGIIGSEDNSENLMYFGVVFVLIVGSFMVRFLPRRMAYVLLATAIAQALTILIALTGGMQHYPGSSVYEIIMINGFFITLFSVSGVLFLRAAEKSDDKNAEASA